MGGRRGGVLNHEKLLTCYLAQVSFAGGLIILVQVGTPTCMYTYTDIYICVCVCVGGGVT